MTATTRTNPDLLDRITDLGFKFFCILFPVLIVYIKITDGNGCGDKPRDFQFFPLAATASFGVALLWCMMDKQKRRYTKLSYSLQILLRYFLAYTIMQYGAAKVVDMQFSSSINSLDSRVIELGPMGLAWTFFGFSYSYEFFIGCGQIIAAIFLLHRRTATLGAILMVTIMANIVFVNFSFNVCVKFFSTTYLVMAVYLLLDDAKRLANFFIFNTIVEPRTYPQFFSKKRAKNIFKLVGILVFVYIVFFPVWGSWSMKTKYHLGQHSAIYGVYTVDSVYASSDSLNAKMNADTSGWKKILFEDFNNAYIKSWKNTRNRFSYEVDSLKHTVNMQNNDSTIVIKVNYTLSKDTLTLKGTQNKDTIFAKMHLLRKYFIRK